MKQKDKGSRSGFTIIEVITTLLLLSLFLGGFFQAFMLLESQRINVARQAKASDIAYSYMRNYNTRPVDPNSPTNSPLTCRTTDQLLVDNEDISGQGLGSDAWANVIASAPRGCSGTEFTDSIIKIEAIITYNGNQEVRHATYINQ